MTSPTAATPTPLFTTTDFLRFLHASPSHFHATAFFATQLLDAGFTRLKEGDDWLPQLKADAGFFYTRNQSSLVAFVLPSAWSAASGVSPFLVLAAHTDSPVLKVKPVSRVQKHSMLQVGVECYGGGLWNTWFDRDLSLAGRVIVKSASSSASSSSSSTASLTPSTFSSRLVSIEEPIMRIPNLAIHLNREVNEKGFSFNKQTHLLPILATAAQTQLNAPTFAAAASPAASSSSSSSHHSVLLTRLASNLQVAVEDIVDLELCLFDTQPACMGGLYKEFVFARALDNLCMSYVTTQAFIHAFKTRHQQAASGAAQTNKPDESSRKQPITMLALFDNEEVGSESYQGAGASLASTLARLHQPGPSSSSSSSSSSTAVSTLPAVLRASLLVSADMAHAVHPNYSEAHEENHRPLLGGGLVLKQNANQRYATSTLSALALQQIAREAGLTLQPFVVRNDSACGSTIGPILSANTNLRVLDVGVPQLAMHSIREMAAWSDIEQSAHLFVLLLRSYSEIEARTLIDE